MRLECVGMSSLIWFCAVLPLSASAQGQAAQGPTAQNSSASAIKSTPLVLALANTAALETILPGARILGAGELTWFGLKVYEAQLWLTPAGAAALKAHPSKYFEMPFVLDLRYARNLAGEAIAERSLAEMRKLGLGASPEHDRWLAEMKRLFPSVKKGDRLTGLHQPGVGVSFYLNDRMLGKSEDVPFARAFFAIWLDERTSVPALREALLRASS